MGRCWIHSVESPAYAAFSLLHAHPPGRIGDEAFKTYSMSPFFSQRLEGAASTLAQQVDVLRKLLDSLALLDLLCSLAIVAKESPRKYIRPRLEDDGPIAILQGRHPVKELQDGVVYQPNDTYLAKRGSCHIITGPNMSGKSTYLKQVIQARDSHK